MPASVSEDNFNPALPFFESVLAHPDRLAVSANGVNLSYAELAESVQKIAGWLQGIKPQRLGRVGILGSRSIMACMGVLGTNWAGGTYVPIGTRLPEERLRAVIALSNLDALIADEAGALLLSDDVLAVAPPHVLVPDTASCPAKALTVVGLRGIDTLETGEAVPPTPMSWNDIAYIEFTSGTTGVPKGVMIYAGALRHYISVIQDRYSLTPDDRVAETADLSFDISVSNMYAAWNAAASLHIIPSTQAMAPVRFIQQNQITYWYSVPSIILFMKKLRALSPGSFPSLRWSIFAGEPLPAAAATTWQAAAPNSIVDNLYGPTEATVVCLVQRLCDPAAVTPERDTVAIGEPFPGTEAAIFEFASESGSQRKPLPLGTVGEIALAGVQLAAGYFGAPELTAMRFPTIDGKRWYLTGDQGYQDESGTFHHLGRLDHQVKISGNRVELEEVETHLRAVSNAELVAAVAWPIAHGSAQGIAAFVSGTGLPPGAIREALRKRLPAYMIPNVIHTLETMPVSASGKVDRKKLVEALEGKTPIL